MIQNRKVLGIIRLLGALINKCTFMIHMITCRNDEVSTVTTAVASILCNVLAQYDR